MGRIVFYNNSAWDAGAGGDDAAIATDKTARMPNLAASYVNTTSFSKGINGVMFDVASLAGPTLAASDLVLKAGPDGNPSGWVAAPAPSSITVRKGAGVAGADRVVLVWPDNSMRNPGSRSRCSRTARPTCWPPRTCFISAT